MPRSEYGMYSVQMPSKCTASARVAKMVQQTKWGHASTTPGSPPIQPSPPVLEVVIDNIANQVLGQIEEHLTTQLSAPGDVTVAHPEPLPPSALPPVCAALSPQVN